MKNKYSRNSVFDKEGNLLPIAQRTFVTNEGYECVLIDGGSSTHYVTCVIREYECEAQLSNIKKGTIRYPFHKSVCATGFLGVGAYGAKSNRKLVQAYVVWSSMLKRCYSDNVHKDFPTYKEATVCDAWHNYQTFAEWFYTESNYQEGWQLDKDLLQEDTKLYSPETCVFLPRELNTFLATAYSSNTSNHTGVYWYSVGNTWRAQIGSNYLGAFTDKEEAIEVYAVARDEKAAQWRTEMQSILPKHAITNII